MANEKKVLAACLSCGRFIDLRDVKNTLTNRCATCRDERRLAGKFGSLIVQGTMTQRELAELKREFYQLYQIDKSLEARKKEFMDRAMAEMNKVIAEVEGELGKPVKDLRARKQQLEARLKEYMQESANTELVIRDLLVEVKNQITNRGGMPQYKEITEDLRNLLKWSDEEMKAFVKARYSQPQYGDVMTVQPLPPGRIRKKKEEQEGTPGAVASFHLEKATSPRLALLHEEFLRTGKKVCKIVTPNEVFILTGEKVREFGLPQMVALQTQTKESLRISDVECKNGLLHVLVEGRFAADPNTVRAFLAERIEGHEITSSYLDGEERIALELTPITKIAQGVEGATAYFTQLENVLTELNMLEQQRGTTVRQILDQTVSAASQMDLPDNEEDLSLKWERHNVGGDSFGTGAQEGITQPESRTPLISLSRKAAQEDLASKILAEHERSGGSTFSLAGENLVGTPSFAVSLHPERSTILPQLTVEDISEFIQKNGDLFKDQRNNIGTWFDSASGKHYLDVVSVVPDREEAVNLGRQFNQISIFDLQKLEEVPTGGTGEAAPTETPL